MQEIIMELAIKWPVFFTIVSVMGMTRLILKPLMAFLHEFVLITESKKDDEILGKVENSKIYKAVIWILDYMISLKLQKPVKQ